MTPIAAFTTCPAPWGEMHVATTSAGIVAVGLDEETPDFVDGLARRLHGPVVPSEDAAVPAEWRARLADATRQIAEFLTGHQADVADDRRSDRLAVLEYLDRALAGVCQ